MQALLALGSGVGAAVLIAGHALGLGLLILVVCCAIGWILVHRPAVEIHLIAFGLLAIGLFTVAFVRSAAWLVGLSLLLGTLLLPIALSHTDSFRAVTQTIFRYLSQVCYALVPLARSLTRTSVKHGGASREVLRGLALAVIPLLLFGLLFASADQVFAEILGDAVPDISNLGLGLRVWIGLLVAALIGGLCLCVTLPQKEDSIEQAGSRSVKTVSWVTALVLIDLLFAIFVGIQIAVLFGGSEHVVETAGLTYAQYARSGFYQLLIVAGLVLSLIALTVRFANVDDPKDRVMLRVLLGLLCLFTGVVLASAIFRIELLEAQYGLTEIRLFGHATTYWIAGIFLFVMLAGIKLHARWLPRALLAYSALFVIVFSFANPEGIIASYNVDRFERTGKIDTVYLSTLSYDALPALLRLPSKQAACAVHKVPQQESWLAFNLSRNSARNAYRHRPVASKSRFACFVGP